MITIHYDFTTGEEVSYAHGMSVGDNFKTNCLDFFTADNPAEEVIIVAKNGSMLSRNILMSNCGKYTEKQIRKSHNILKMFKAGAFDWLSKPVTASSIQIAMQETAEEVRAPRAVRKGIVSKPKTVEDFKNEGSNKFIDIDSEIYRTYVYPDGDDITIKNPLKLCVKENGHRVWDAQNISHYVPAGWRHLYWSVKDGQPNFVK